MNRLAPAGVTIEVGPVANNVIRGELVMKVYQIINTLLSWDFSDPIDLSDVDYYKMTEVIHYPEEMGWYVHPSVEQNDFKELKDGDPFSSMSLVKRKNMLVKHRIHFL